MFRRNFLLLWLLILLTSIFITFNACTKQNAEDYCQISTNSDLSYSYKITDRRGNILFSEDAAKKEPSMKFLTPAVLEISTQADYRLSTNWAIYCNVKTGVVSEKFTYVLGAKDKYIFYVEYKDGVHSIICQNIFDKEAMFQEYILDIPVVLDSFGKANFETDGVASIPYATGETTISQQHIRIYFPN